MEHVGPQILERAAAGVRRRIERDRKRCRVQVRRILAYLQANLFSPALTVRRICGEIGIRDTAISTAFHAEVGWPISTYLRRCRLEVGCRLLRDTDLPIAVIASLVGYRHLQSFSAAFNRVHGVRPSIYREGGLAGPPVVRPQPGFVIGEGAVVEGEVCGRCGAAFEAGRYLRLRERGRPLCDTCALEHGPPALSRLLILGALERVQTAQQHLVRVGAHRQVEDHEFDEAEATATVWALLTRYPGCVDAVEEVMAVRRGTLGSGSRPPDDSGAAARDLAAFLQASEVERLRARKVWEAQAHQEPKALAACLCGLEPRFKTPALVNLLRTASERLILDDPARGCALAEGLPAVVAAVDPALLGQRGLADLHCDAWAWLANTRRVANHLDAAATALETARAYRRQGTDDLKRRARLLDYEASLRRDQRRFDEALVAIDRALALNRKLQAPVETARALINKATIFQEQCRFEHASPLLRQALTLIDAETHPHVQWCGELNLTLCMHECGRNEEASRRLDLLKALTASLDEEIKWAKLRWLEGRVAAARGEKKLGEEHLKRAQAAFIAAELPFDAALVSLELAALYCDERHTAGLRDLAAALQPLFGAKALHREALAALDVFHQALMAERRLSPELITRLRAYLQEARYDATLRFDEECKALRPVSS